MDNKRGLAKKSGLEMNSEKALINDSVAFFRMKFLSGASAVVARLHPMACKFADGIGL